MKRFNTLARVLFAGAVGLIPMQSYAAKNLDDEAVECSVYEDESAALVSQSNKKIEELRVMIERAKREGINTLKEETALRTAEIFMVYADWDEANMDKNAEAFELIPPFQAEHEKWATLLPDFEREEVLKMMDSSLVELQRVLDGEIYRLPSPRIDWSAIKIEGDQITQDGKPVFIADWIWKQKSPLLTEYHGNQDGSSLSTRYMIDESGELDPKYVSDLKVKPDGNFGSVFVSHNGAAKWIEENYPDATDFIGGMFTTYDINHPIIRQTFEGVIEGLVPLMAGKKYTELGYMLCNEPHWNSVEGVWDSHPLSEYAYADFMKWLEQRHGKIKNLNELWGTNYRSYADVDCPRMMKAEYRGTPIYYDFIRYNMYRVTEWFRFLQSEIKKYDPAAKTHIKIMPLLWTRSDRDSGIDLEALTYDSDIIGNDVESCGAWMSGQYRNWQRNYAFEWAELCMAQDFFKSVSPEKIMYNSEGHMLSTVHYRDLYQEKEYARCNYWLGCIHGITAIETWYWSRAEDGTPRFLDKDYPGSNNHQPRIVNEVHATMIDLNSVADKIMAFQRQRKPIRVFYTEASAINQARYSDDMFSTYEKVVFEGLPIGFATNNIIKRNNNSDWEVIVVNKTPNCYEADIDALQSYLDQGGDVIVDRVSLKFDEYGRKMKRSLKSTKGRVIEVSNLDEAKARAMEVVEANSGLPSLLVEDVNGLEQKGCLWRVIPSEGGANILSLVNISKNSTKLTILNRDMSGVKSMKNVLTGETITDEDLYLHPNATLLLEVR